LLVAGPLTAALELDPLPLSNYFASHPSSADESLLDLAVRHPTGCELLCVGPGSLNGQRLRLLLPVLRRAYDVVVVDVPLGDRWLSDVAVETSDVSLLIAAPTSASASAATAWADRAWERGLEGKLAVVINRVAAGTVVPNFVMSGLLHRAMVSDDRVAASDNGEAFPWVLRFESHARMDLSDLSRQLLPDLIKRGSDRAA